MKRFITAIGLVALLKVTYWLGEFDMGYYIHQNYEVGPKKEKTNEEEDKSKAN